MAERVDFRVARLERRVFGTETPTSGTAGGVVLTTKDLITRIVELESALLTASVHTSGAGEPSALTGKDGDTYWDTTGLMEWVKMGGTWRQRS